MNIWKFSDVLREYTRFIRYFSFFSGTVSPPVAPRNLVLSHASPSFWFLHERSRRALWGPPVSGVHRQCFASIALSGFLDISTTGGAFFSFSPSDFLSVPFTQNTSIRGRSDRTTEIVNRLNSCLHSIHQLIHLDMCVGLIDYL